MDITELCCRRGQRLEEEEEEVDAWPLPDLEGCPTEGVLTVEPGAHLGTLMTQYALLYGLSRQGTPPVRQLFTFQQPQV